ncbi:MAG: hypothetical protein ABIH21_00150 [Patescibacteria group bacterium]
MRNILFIFLTVLFFCAGCSDLLCGDENVATIKARERADRLDSRLAEKLTRIEELEEADKKKAELIVRWESWANVCQKTLAGAPALVHETEKAKKLAMRQLRQSLVRFNTAVRVAGEYPTLPEHKAIATVAFPPPIEVEFSSEEAAEGEWQVPEKQCLLVYARPEPVSATKQFVPSISSIVSLVLSELGRVANTDPQKVSSDDDWQLYNWVTDPQNVQNSLVDGSFLYVLGHIDEVDSEGGYVMARGPLLRAMASLANDPTVVDLLAGWGLTILRSTDFVPDKTAEMIKTMLPAFWYATWSDFPQIERDLEQNEYLFSLGYHDDERPRAQGWFYRRWVAAGKGAKGNALIAKYRLIFVDVARTFRLNDLARVWESQIKSGKGPPPPPEPEPDPEDEEEGEGE